ncbi:hypothetical protein C8R43DRAFT_1192062 [Mycena crocata]|nr:hypothetical protein C8R43DRAFT_1192062 [Mycena crocata]
MERDSARKGFVAAREERFNQKEVDSICGESKKVKNQRIETFTTYDIGAAAEEALAKFSTEIHPSSSVVPVQLDVRDDASIQAAHAAIADHLKSKDLPGLPHQQRILIYPPSAGVMVPSFKETYQVNVSGTVAVTEGIRSLINPGGAILKISSVYGSSSQLPKIEWFHAGLAAYSSSKSALNNLTVQWALDEKQKGSGIRVVSICPGRSTSAFTSLTKGVRL